MVSRTFNFSDSRVSCSEMPIHSRNCRGLSFQVWPKMRTSPEVGASRPSRISIVVVLPAPFRTEQPKALSRFDAQTEAADGFDFAVVGLAQLVHSIGEPTKAILAQVRPSEMRARNATGLQPAWAHAFGIAPQNRV